VVGSEPGVVASGFSRTRNVRLETAFRESTVAGATIDSGSTVKATVNGREVAYDADLRARTVDLQRIGRAFNVPALTVDRYASDINAHVTAIGQGTDPKAMTVSARGEVTDSTILGGRIPQLSFDANLSGDTLTAKAAGSFSRFDPRWSVGAKCQRDRGRSPGREAIVANVVGVTPESIEARPG
jgi:hypothetical protein